MVSAMPATCREPPLAADIQVTPDGRSLYASERTSNTLALFRCIPEEGRLEKLGHVATESSPRSIAIAPRGRFLLAAGQLSRALTVYRIDDATGALAPLRSHPMGRNPSWIEIVEEPR
jgi:6-phosphogluconolactonase